MSDDQDGRRPRAPGFHRYGLGSFEVVPLNAPVRCALDELDVANVMLSTDYPFKDTETATDWISQAS